MKYLLTANRRNDGIKYLKEEILYNIDDPEQLYIPLKFDVPFPPKVNPKFKFIDLFAGIGGIRLAYQNLGGKCVFTSEWNNFAKKKIGRIFFPKSIFSPST